MWGDAKRRSIRLTLPFTITPSDIIIPMLCPALGIPLFKGVKLAGNNSPTLDRIIPHLGYVPGNVVVLSNLANRIKSSASHPQIQQVATWLKGIIDKVNH